MIRKSPYIDENYATLMSSDLNLVLTNNNTQHPIAFEENSLNFLNRTAKKEEEKSVGFSNNLMIDENFPPTPEKKENNSSRKKKLDESSLSIFSSYIKNL